MSRLRAVSIRSEIWNGRALDFGCPPVNSVAGAGVGAAFAATEACRDCAAGAAAPAGGRGWCRLRFRQRWFSAWLCCGRWLRRGGMLCSRIFGSGPWPKRKMQRAVPGGQRWFASLIGKPQLHRQNQQDYQQRQQKKKQPAYEFEHRQQDGEHNGHRQSLPFQLFAVLGGIDGRIRFSF